MTIVIKKEMRKLNLLIAMLIFATITVLAQQKDECCTIHTKSYAAMDSKGVMVPYEFSRRTVNDNDVLIEILYSGVCHSDVHQVLGHWNNSIFPMVPGHEITGRVTKVGKKVKNFKVGDYAGVGPMINSCGECSFCQNSKEQHCENRKTVYTYNARDWEHGNQPTNGGYANNIVVKEDFVIKIPKNAPIEKIGPLFCAGVTTYAPLKNADIKKGDLVGVAGFGGLGHLALQYALAMGAEVIVFDISEKKREIAMKMGAKRYVNVNNPKELEGLDNSFRMILNMIPANYNVEMYIKMLKYGGEMVLIGQPAISETPSVDTQVFVENPGRKIYFSLIGGIAETQEMLNYSIRHNIYPSIEIIPMDKINEAFKKVVSGDVSFRYVIDMSTLK